MAPVPDWQDRFGGTLEPVPGLAALGFTAFTTTRRTGDFGTRSPDSARDVFGRWERLRAALGAAGESFVTAGQVHGARVLKHMPMWRGWLRAGEADGHMASGRATGMAVTIADCTPVFIVHPAGAAALLHAGWRGTAAGIAETGVATLGAAGFPARELLAHLGPSICGRCYEVGPEVHAALTGRIVGAPEPVDVRAVLADRLLAAGVPGAAITVSEQCTLCTEDRESGERRFFSHRGGDHGRQVAALGWSGNPTRSP